MSESLWPHGLQPARRLCPWNFPGTNTEVGCHFLLQGIFPMQGSNAGVKPMSLASPVLPGKFFTTAPLGRSDHINRYRKSFWKNSTSFMIKTLSKLGIENNFNLINNSYKNPVNIILIGKKLKAFPLRSETRKGCSFSPLLFRITLEMLASATRQEETCWLQRQKWNCFFLQIIGSSK